MRVHALLSGSLANGPGRSFVIWVQGCTLGCPGCCNPKAQDRKGGTEMRVPELVEKIIEARDIDTVVVSGGEPLEQVGELDLLMGALMEQRPDLRRVLFTGFKAATLRTVFGPALGMFDLIVAGPYDASCPRTAGDPPLLASKNQELLYPTGRIKSDDLVGIPDVEFILDETTGDLVRTGIGV